MAADEGFVLGTTYTNKEIWFSWKEYPAVAADWKKYVGQFEYVDDSANTGEKYIYYTLEADPNPPGGGITIPDEVGAEGDYSNASFFRITYAEPAAAISPPEGWNVFKYNTIRDYTAQGANNEFPGTDIITPQGSLGFFQENNGAIGGAFMSRLDVDGNDWLSVGNFGDTPSTSLFSVNGLWSFDDGVTWEWYQLGTLNQYNTVAKALNTAPTDAIYINGMYPLPFGGADGNTFGLPVKPGGILGYTQITFAFPTPVPFALPEDAIAAWTPEMKKVYTEQQKLLPKGLRTPLPKGGK
jgi:hypothetical protein